MRIKDEVPNTLKNGQKGLKIRENEKFIKFVDAGAKSEKVSKINIRTKVVRMDNVSTVL